VQTVENIFDFSFDIKEGLAELKRDTVSFMYMQLYHTPILSMYFCGYACLSLQSSDHCYLKVYVTSQMLAVEQQHVEQMLLSSRNLLCLQHSKHSWSGTCNT
jgi:Nse4 C-terminal